MSGLKELLGKANAHLYMSTLGETVDRARRIVSGQVADEATTFKDQRMGLIEIMVSKRQPMPTSQPELTERMRENAVDTLEGMGIACRWPRRQSLETR